MMTVIFCFLVLTLGSWQIPPISSFKNNLDLKGEKASFEIHIHSGNQNKNCSGFGICSIAVKDNSMSINDAIFAIPYIASNEIVGLEIISVADRHKKTVENQLKLGYFKMETAFSCEIINASSHYKFNWPSGQHPVIALKNSWYISPLPK